MLITRAARRTVRPSDDHGVGRRTVTRGLTAMLVAASWLAAAAGPAQAYGAATCDALFGADQVEEVVGATIDTGFWRGVDFGDNPHASHAPGGKAVICWLENGEVAVIGRLFADPLFGSATVSARLSYYNNGIALQHSSPPSVTGVATNADAANRLIVDVASGDVYDQVRIRLYNGGQQVASVDHNR